MVPTAPFWTTGSYLSDGGLETELIYNYGVELPEFAAFPLADAPEGRALLTSYYDQYAAVARKAGKGLTMESPTWRANPEWGAKLGYDAAQLARANRAAIALLRELRATYLAAGDLADVQVIGAVGPRDDGYLPGRETTPGEAMEYHLPQIAVLAEAGADVIAAYTLTGVTEAIGVSRAAAKIGAQVWIGFTVETDGRLPDGTALGEAVAAVEAAQDPDGFLINCAHPTHVARGLDGGQWLERIVQLNPNASALSHAELDAADDLDTGDLALLSASVAELSAELPNLAVLGGCCGTDATHIAAMAGVS